MKRSHWICFAMASNAVCVAVILLLIGGNARARTSRKLRDAASNSSSSVGPTPEALHMPRVVLWAWERPEDLRFIDPQKMGVAFLAGTIELHSLPPGSDAVGIGVVLRSRHQPLRVPPGMALMAVVRIESSNDLWHHPVVQASEPSLPATLYTAAQRERMASLVTEATQLPGVTAIQIDFDAAQSERAFYASLLQDVRRRLPSGMPLSITALASWCIGDPWLESLPTGTIDEAVPMLFRMGTDAANVADFLKSGNEFRPSVCRSSLGLSTDEPFSQELLAGTIQLHSSGKDTKRIYIFSNHAWTEDEARILIKGVAR